MAGNADNTPVILIVEDEAKVARLLREYLERSAYRAHWINTGGEAVAWVRDNNPALILLDVMLPEKDGLSICREIRQFSDVPIIMVTARADEIDRLLGLELGADDYICKPFSPREVVARVKVVLRRMNGQSASPEIGYRGLGLDKARHRALVHGEPLNVTPVEFRLLNVLLNQPGRVFSRQQLMNHAYTDGRVVSDRTMDTHIKNLRRKLEAALPETELIHSVYGVGYRLE